jgi:hypothetical protein
MDYGDFPLNITQGATTVFQLVFVKDGQSLPIQDIKFVGVVKNSIYDTEGFPMRFDKVNNNTVNVYIDADVTESMEFTKGVHEIKMIQVDGFNSVLLRGSVDITLGASDETSYN